MIQLKNKSHLKVRVTLKCACVCIFAQLSLFVCHVLCHLKTEKARLSTLPPTVLLRLIITPYYWKLNRVLYEHSHKHTHTLKGFTYSSSLILCNLYLRTNKWPRCCRLGFRKYAQEHIQTTKYSTLSQMTHAAVLRLLCYMSSWSVKDFLFEKMLFVDDTAGWLNYCVESVKLRWSAWENRLLCIPQQSQPNVYQSTCSSGEMSCYAF